MRLAFVEKMNEILQTGNVIFTYFNLETHQTLRLIKFSLLKNNTQRRRVVTVTVMYRSNTVRYITVLLKRRH